MNTHIGEQLYSPNGFRTLSKSTRYYFAGRRDEDGSALLIWFSKHKDQRRAHFVRLTADQFERALLEDPPSLIPESKQFTLPEWLSEYEGISFDQVEEFRYQKKKTTYREQVETRFSKISNALHHKNEILASNDPLKEICKFTAPSENRYRVQVWFFSYFLHSCNIWALMRSNRET